MLKATLKEYALFTTLIVTSIILITLSICLSYSAGWNFGYAQKVEGVNKPMIASVGHNCKIIYVRKKVLAQSSLIRGLFICSDNENETTRTHLRVLFAHVRSLDELYFFKGAGYVYDCLTGNIKVVWPHPLTTSLFFEFNTSLARDFCKIDLAYNLSLVEIEGCENCYANNMSFYGFDEFSISEDLNSLNELNN